LQPSVFLNITPHMRESVSFPSLASVRNGICVAGAVVLVAACGDPHPTATDTVATGLPASVLQVLDCTASITTATVSCGAPAASGASRTIIGGQNVYVRLTSSNIIVADGNFEVDVTVQNLLNEAIGTPDGTVADPQGIRIFFHSEPTTTAGVGGVSVANADGTGTFTAGNQPFYRYAEILAKNQVSAAKTWQFAYDAGVEAFSFQVYVETDVQYLLVINELLANPGGTIFDFDGEWIEIYNAGTLAVNVQNLVIADSAPSGRRPFHLVTVSHVIPSGGYWVIGNNSDTTLNGGVLLDYSYGNAMAFANSVDAFKISRVVGQDTLTLDRTQYASGALSAQNGVSRELKNPALDNANMDGSNWAHPLVTAVYGPGGRGTPGAQNSTFAP
jgi:hypothetical protein